MQREKAAAGCHDGRAADRGEGLALSLAKGLRVGGEQRGDASAGALFNQEVEIDPPAAQSSGRPAAAGATFPPPDVPPARREIAAAAGSPAPAAKSPSSPGRRGDRGWLAFG